MKTIKAISFLKLIFKSFFIIFLIFNLNIKTYSNPIMPPPIITEIYFSPGGWSIELYFAEIFYDDQDLSNYRMVGLYDTAQFLARTCPAGEAFDVTQDDFASTFTINPEGDFLHLQTFYNGEWLDIDYWGIGFGNISQFHMTGAPLGDESIAYQYFYDSSGEGDFWIVKEKPNSIGSYAFDVNKRAAFSGYVLDRVNEPLPDIKLEYCPEYFHYYTTPSVPVIMTNTQGYFHTEYMFCRNYTMKFYHDGQLLSDTNIVIEPDSLNYFEFKLDTLLTGINENVGTVPHFLIRNAPNPCSNLTEFIIEISQINHNQAGVIKIYNDEGIIVDIIPVEMTAGKQEISYDTSAKSLPNGVYPCKLEIGHQCKASAKMIISR